MADPTPINELISKANRHMEARQWDKADRLLRKALKQAPDNVEILQRIGAVQRRLNQPRKAIDTFKKGLASAPTHTGLLSEYVGVLQDTGRTGDALAIANKAIDSHPENPDLLALRSRLLMSLGDTAGAQRDCEQAHHLQPDDPVLHARYVDSLIASGAIPIPDESARSLVDRQPFESRNHSRLGTVLRLNDQLDEAMHCYEKSLELDTRNPDAIAGKAEILQSRNESDAAAELLAPHVRSGQCGSQLLMAWMRVQNSRKAWDDSIDVASRWLAAGNRTPRQVAIINHRLGDALDKSGRYEEAFDAWQRGNSIFKHRWDPGEHARVTTELIETFSNDAMQSMPRSDRDSDRPLFIMGMFRSGTTLTEQVLSMHPRVHGAGELGEMLAIAGDLPSAIDTDEQYPGCMKGIDSIVLNAMADRYLQSLDKSSDAGDVLRITDKLPMNFLNIGLITLLFPRARIIHCLRDPLDTCLSCFGNSFSSRMAFTADLDNLGHAYLDYLRIMDHWRSLDGITLHEIRYEDLVSDPEPHVRGLLEFAGLDWDPACLEFHRSGRVAQTLSMDQVREPMHTRSIHRSRRYWEPLAPLRAVLGDLVADSPDG